MTPKILSLPPEVKLKILDHLPIKNVQALRGVCKDFKLLVDLNKTKIATPVITRETKRLTDYAADCVFYPDDLTCIDALMRWCKLKGNWKCGKCERMLHAMAIHHIIGRPDAAATFATLTADQSLYLIHHPFPIYQACFLDRGTTSDKDTIMSNLTMLGAPGYFSFDSTVATELCGELIRTRDGSQIEQHEADEHFVDLVQNFALTPARAMPHDVERLQIDEVPGCCSATALSETFGLPILPRSKLFAYFVKSRKIKERLSTLLEGSEEAVTLDPTFKAAVLEEMYIF